MKRGCDLLILFLRSRAKDRSVPQLLQGFVQDWVMKGEQVKFQTQKTPVLRPGSLLSIPKQPVVAFGVSRRSVILETDMAQRTGLEPATPGVTGRYSNRLNYRCVSL